MKRPENLTPNLGHSHKTINTEVMEWYKTNLVLLPKPRTPTPHGIVFNLATLYR